MTGHPLIGMLMVERVMEDRRREAERRRHQLTTRQAATDPASTGFSLVMRLGRLRIEVRREVGDVRCEV